MLALEELQGSTAQVILSILKRTTRYHESVRYRRVGKRIPVSSKNHQTGERRYVGQLRPKLNSMAYKKYQAWWNIHTEYTPRLCHMAVAAPNTFFFISRKRQAGCSCWEGRCCELQGDSGGNPS